MTKHVSPAIAGTELNGTDYIRVIDSEVMLMREDGHDTGRFVRYPRKNAEELKDAAKSAKKVRRTNDLTVLEQLLKANTEAPKNVSLQFVQKNLAAHFDSYGDKDDSYTIEQDDKDEASIGEDCFTEGKRRVRSKRKCNTRTWKGPWRNITITKVDEQASADIRTCFRSNVTHIDYRAPGGDFLFDGVWFRQTECSDLAQTKARKPDGRRFRDIVKSDWLWLLWQVQRYIDRVPFIADLGGNTVPEGLRDNAQETLRNRTTLEQYRATAPKNDSDIFSRKPRNASPTHEKDARRLNAWMEYRRLNGSLEPLQSDTERYDDAEREEYGADRPERSPDAELETRPTINELVALYSVRNVQYEEKRVGGDGPPFMKIPMSGDVECIGFHKDRTLPECEDAARKELGINATQKRIDKFVERNFRVPMRLNIAEVDVGRDWSIFRIGGLYFAPGRTKDYRGQVVWRGALTNYKDKNGVKRRVKVDVSGTSYGPEFLGSANQNDDEDMARKGWMVLNPLTRKTRELSLSDDEKKEQRANKDADENKKRRDLYHRRLRGPHRHPMPYDVKCDLADAVYVFGSEYTKPEVPTDDVVERGSQLARVNAMLSPEGLLVANAIVLTDRSDELAQNQREIGALLWTGTKEASDITLTRLGKQGILDTADELISIFQKLAAD